MSFYGDMEFVEEFAYRDHAVEVFRTERGGHCEKCDLDHEPRKRRCDSCGDEIRTFLICRVHVNGSDLGVDCSDVDDAREFAKLWIDEQVDGNTAPKVLSPPVPDLPVPKPNSKRGKKQRSEGVNAPASRGRAKLISQIKQLGWGRKLQAILNRLPGKA